jgi:SAM-dependent methyltransferase
MRRVHPTASPAPVVSPAPDLWHHYGRVRAERDPDVPAAFFWNWTQDAGPGAEILGDLTGRVVGDLGAGAARHAAYLATRHRARRVCAVDASPAQHGFAAGLFGHLTPRLRLVHDDAVSHLRAAPGAYDVLYSVFGALCFTDPRALLPAAAAALRPGGRLVFSTLARFTNGSAAPLEAVPTGIQARTPDGRSTLMPRWVLREHTWTELLDEAGFTQITVDLLPATAEGARTADTLLLTCTRPV